MSNIKVIARFRPQNSIEDREGGIPIVTIDDTETSVHVDSKEYPGQFNFDKIFDWNTKQSDIFSECGRALVQQCFEGFNSTLFCYGQTGSGKTFTMMGNIADEQLKGMTPRLVEQIFDTIHRAPSHLEFTVKVSFMEIYMEKIRDLLNTSHDNLPIHEDKTRGVYIKGIQEVYVSSISEVFQVLKIGDEARSVSSTNMNEQSSRSHSIFVLTIYQKDLETGTSKTGKLYLVDLAGSEKVGKTGATGQTLEEAKKINKSLSALGMVINALTDGKSSHIPYRDSKLTRILQESLGGNSKTTLIVNCSPSSYNDAETVSTLRFGTRAKSITNKAVINVELSSSELKTLLKNATTKIASLQVHIANLEKEIMIWRSGKSVSKEEQMSLNNNVNSNMIPSEVEMSTMSLVGPADKEEFYQRENMLVDQIAEKESELEKLKRQLESVIADLNISQESEKNISLEHTEFLKEFAQLKLTLEKAIFDLKEKELSLEALKDENEELLSKLQSALYDLDKLRYQLNKDSEELLDAEKRHKSAVKREKTEQMLKDLAGENFVLSDDILKENQPSMNEIDHLREINRMYEERCGKLEEEIAELLDGAIAGEEVKSNVETVAASVLDFKRGIENEFEIRRKQFEEDIEHKSKLIETKDAELENLKKEIHSLRMSTSDGTETNVQLKQMMVFFNSIVEVRLFKAKQLQDFENSKKALMRDLQDRCGKVVELEIQLDEIKEKERHSMRELNERNSQKRLQFLERNLDQLTKVQKALVEENSSLKKDIRISEKKIVNRNERIDDLERILQDLSAKMGIEQEKYDKRMEELQTRVRQLEETNTRMSQNQPQNVFPFQEGKIAKPLRGGTNEPSSSQ